MKSQLGNLVIILLIITQSSYFLTGQASSGEEPEYKFVKTQGSWLENPNLGKIRFIGKNNSGSFTDGAWIKAMATGTVSGSIPVDLTFHTGLRNLEERIRIGANGNIGVNAADLPSRFTIRQYTSELNPSNNILLVEGGLRQKAKQFRLYSTSNFPEILEAKLQGNFWVEEGHAQIQKSGASQELLEVIAGSSSNSSIFKISSDAGSKIQALLQGNMEIESGNLMVKDQNVFVPNGRLMVGTNSIQGQHVAAFNGSILCTTVKIDYYQNWPDYVFSDTYKLKELSEVEKYIIKNKHLPDMPSAEEVSIAGYDMVEIQAKLLQKLEELTLYTIELKKEIDLLKRER